MAKVGLSFSRCLLDIVEKRVNIDDVLVVIARTIIDPRVDDEWNEIWDHYTMYEWCEYDHRNSEHEKMFRDVAIALLTEGKLHQPRQFGARPVRRAEYWLETVLPSEELNVNPVAKAAWEKFQTVAGLTGVSLDKKYR